MYNCIYFLLHSSSKRRNIICVSLLGNNSSGNYIYVLKIINYTCKSTVELKRLQPSSNGMQIIVKLIPI